MPNSPAYGYAFHPSAIPDTPPEKSAMRLNSRTGQEHIAASHKLLNELTGVLTRLVDKQRKPVTVNYALTDYVIPGCLYHINTPSYSYPVWVGINGQQLRVISYLSATLRQVEIDFQQVLLACAGWEFGFLPVRDSHLTFSCSCLSERPLVELMQNSGVIQGDTPQKVTSAGHFYVHEIALLLQHYVYAMDAANIKSPEYLTPGPF